MKKTQYIIAVTFLVVGFVAGYFLNNNQIPITKTDSEHNSETLESPYSGEEIRGIKSLSEQDVEGLLAGEGTPFGGMAKLAELNGYPGPRHVLDMAEELNLTNSQAQQIIALYEEMKNEAIDLGTLIIDEEQNLSDAFANEAITEGSLKKGITASANNYADLRFVHLKYHLAMMDILSVEQINTYNELRGYTNSSVDPCENVPEGHDPELWRMHNNCN